MKFNNVGLKLLEKQFFRYYMSRAPRPQQNVTPPCMPLGLLGKVGNSFENKLVLDTTIIRNLGNFIRDAFELYGHQP